MDQLTLFQEGSHAKISASQKPTLGGGKAEGIKGKKSGLWKEYARIIRQIGPGIIVFENSSMLLRRGLEHVLCDLSELGYDAEWRLFYAAQFGYDHYRPRIYGVAYSRRHRWNKVIEKGGILQKVPIGQSPRQARVPMPSKRYDGRSDFGSVLLDDGFYSQLDQKKIFGYGNAIVVDIAVAIFTQIKDLE